MHNTNHQIGLLPKKSSKFKDWYVALCWRHKIPLRVIYVLGEGTKRVCDECEKERKSNYEQR